MPGAGIASTVLAVCLTVQCATGLAAEPVEVQRQPGIPAGLTANNPLNLMFVGQSDAMGYVPLRSGRRVAAYPSTRAGVAAELRQLLAYQSSGFTTVRQMVTRWVSDPAADLRSYIADVSASIGVTPDQQIDVRDPATAAAFVLGAQSHESGIRPVAHAPVALTEAAAPPVRRITGARFISISVGDK